MANHDAAIQPGEGHLRGREADDDSDDGDNDATRYLSASTSSMLQVQTQIPAKGSLWTRMGLGGLARRTLGLILLLLTVFLWTASNFMNSFIFADETYDNPFFVVYVNTSIFAISLIPTFFRYMAQAGITGLRRDSLHLWNHLRHGSITSAAIRRHRDDYADDHSGDAERLLSDPDLEDDVAADADSTDKLDFRDTAVLSFQFCVLWFSANYFASACLQYTSVASVTILSSTSSAWTLMICAFYGIERFSVRKLVGVGASLVGVVLISMVDISGKTDDNRGSFPHKEPGQIALGDAMALGSAVLYGGYVTLMKRRVGSEERVDMQLFFGLVGVFNLVLLWPIFFLLHWTGIEEFELPPSAQVWTIIIVNALASFISDIAWAYSMLLTSPLVVTVGLSLTIPLSLVGEMWQYSQYSSVMYWFGAVIVVASFVFVNHESNETGEKKVGQTSGGSGVVQHHES